MFLFALHDNLNTRNLNKALLFAMQLNQEWFYDDFVVEAVYGCPPTCILNGFKNNYFPEAKMSVPEEWLDSIVAFYRIFGVNYCLTFNNTKIQPQHLSDLYCNTILKASADKNISVMVSSSVIVDYLAKKYPAIAIRWDGAFYYGETADELLNFVKEKLQHNIWTLPSEFNSSDIFEQLGDLKDVEILLNDNCFASCPRHREHRDLISSYNLLDAEVCPDCLCDNSQYDNYHFDKCIFRDKLLKYGQLHLTHFRLEDHGNPERNLMSYMEIFVRPNYQDEFKKFYHDCNETNFWNLRSMLDLNVGNKEK